MKLQTTVELQGSVDVPAATAHAQLLVYVAAPYTEPDPVQNTHHVVRIADALLAAGIIPLVPHLTLLWHLISPKPYESWLAYDRQLLRRCDAVLRVPGYSNGATQEAALAESEAIPVIRPRSSDPADCVAAVVAWLTQQHEELQ